jgi:hypothetical protein
VFYGIWDFRHPVAESYIKTCVYWNITHSGLLLLGEDVGEFFLNALQLIRLAFKKHELDTNTFVKKLGREIFLTKFCQTDCFSFFVK